MNMPFEIPIVNWWVLAPLAVVVVTASLTLLWGVLLQPRSNTPQQVIALIGLGVAMGLYVLAWMDGAFGSSFDRAIVNDRLAIFFGVIILGATMLALLFAEEYLKERGINYSEYIAMLLLATSGALMMVSTLDLIVLFLGLEIMSISLYVLCGLARTQERSGEAAIKYFLLGAFASGFLLYGIALIYGAVGSTSLDAALLTLSSAGSEQRTLMMGGLALLLVGLGFKAALVPFHMWTPDVYQGAPTAITGYMASVVKVAAFAALLRVVGGLAPLLSVWQPALFWIALATMTVGNLVAIFQSDAKRMLAYSSIAHAGYILVGIVAANRLGTMAVLYYAIAYSLVTVGAFAVISLMAREDHETADIRDMAGFWTRRPIAAGAMILFMASLAGIPPTAGFFAKFALFQASISAAREFPGPIGSPGHVTLAVALALNSAISLFYYLRIIISMYINEPDAETGALVRRSDFGTSLAVAVCASGVLYVGIAYSSIGGLLREAVDLPVGEPAMTSVR